MCFYSRLQATSFNTPLKYDKSKGKREIERKNSKKKIAPTLSSVSSAHVANVQHVKHIKNSHDSLYASSVDVILSLVD